MKLLKKPEKKSKVPLATVTPRYIIASKTYDRFKGLCPDCEKVARAQDTGERPNIGYNGFSPDFMFEGQPFSAIEGEIIRLLIAGNLTGKMLKTKELKELVYGPTLYDTSHSLRQRIYYLRNDPEKRLEKAGYEILGHGAKGYQIVNIIDSIVNKALEEEKEEDLDAIF